MFTHKIDGLDIDLLAPFFSKKSSAAPSANASKPISILPREPSEILPTKDSPTLPDTALPPKFPEKEYSPFQFYDAPSNPYFIPRASASFLFISIILA